MNGRTLSGGRKSPFRIGRNEITQTSPADGEGVTALTRESIITFNDPIDPNTLHESSLFAVFAETTLAARIHLSPDGRRATLFFDPPLPENARVRLIIDGDTITNIDGQPVDADNDGQPGGLRLVDFDTLGLTQIPQTIVTGRVLPARSAAAARTSRLRASPFASMACPTSSPRPSATESSV